jgi:hypothetical protein
MRTTGQGNRQRHQHPPAHAFPHLVGMPEGSD